MNDWVIFAVGSLATLLCVVATGFLLYAIGTDAAD